MKDLETRVSKLEALFMPSGPVLIFVDTVRTAEQQEAVDRARAAGLAIIFVSSVDEAL